MSDIKMVRKQAIDPSITVIMNTFGGHQGSIERSIRSFLDQSYGNATLLIVNTHPDRLVIKDKPDKIIVHNTEDVFTYPIHQYKHGFKLVATDCWTILDDDDWMEPNHLKQLVDLWNIQGERNGKPLQVCIPHVNAEYDGGVVKPVDFKGWWCSLFERLTPAQVEKVYANFPKERMCGSDTWISDNTFFDRRYSEGERTYHWDRTGNVHVSFHESLDERKGPADCFEISRRYWENKLRARGLPLLEINLI